MSMQSHRHGWTYQGLRLPLWTTGVSRCSVFSGARRTQNSNICQLPVQNANPPPPPPPIRPSPRTRACLTRSLGFGFLPTHLMVSRLLLRSVEPYDPLEPVPTLETLRCDMSAELDMTRRPPWRDLEPLSGLSAFLKALRTPGRCLPVSGDPPLSLRTVSVPFLLSAASSVTFEELLGCARPPVLPLPCLAGLSASLEPSAETTVDSCDPAERSEVGLSFRSDGIPCTDYRPLFTAVWGLVLSSQTMA